MAYLTTNEWYSCSKYSLIKPCSPSTTGPPLSKDDMTYVVVFVLDYNTIHCWLRLPILPIIAIVFVFVFGIELVSVIVVRFILGSIQQCPLLVL